MLPEIRTILDINVILVIYGIKKPSVKTPGVS